MEQEPRVDPWGAPYLKVGINMYSTSQSPKSENRIYFLDNLRTFLIFLVIALHAGITYESSGWPAFFWIVDDPATNDLSGLVNMVLDIFIMPGMFFIAGYFAPLSLGSKTQKAFLWGKFRRIMVPWILAVFTLMPAYKAIFLYSRDLPQENWTTYFHFSNGVFSQSWLWFLPILFMFYLLYLLVIRIQLDISKLTFSKGFWLVALLGLLQSGIFYFFKWEGWTKIVILDFQNEKLLIYFMLFLLGALGYRRGVFTQPVKSKSLFHTINATSWIPILAYIAFFLYPYIKPGSFVISESMDPYLIKLFFHLSLIALLYSTFMTFRIYLNKTSAWIAELNANAYGVYILHLIVLGLIATLLLHVDIGSKSKYLILIVTTFLVSNVLVSSYRWIKTRTN